VICSDNHLFTTTTIKDGAIEVYLQQTFLS
jgi:hypothetical protein